MQQRTMIEFLYILHLLKVLSSTFYTHLNPLEAATHSFSTLHPASPSRQQQHFLGWEICVHTCGSSHSGTGKSHMGPGRDCRLDESLISPASFSETQLLHWLSGKRHCQGGAEFLAVLYLAASPEFFRILGGAKLLYTISL